MTKFRTQLLLSIPAVASLSCKSAEFNTSETNSNHDISQPNIVIVAANGPSLEIKVYEKNGKPIETRDYYCATPSFIREDDKLPCHHSKELLLAQYESGKRLECSGATDTYSGLLTTCFVWETVDRLGVTDARFEADDGHGSCTGRFIAKPYTEGDMYCRALGISATHKKVGSNILGCYSTLENLKKRFGDADESSRMGFVQIKCNLLMPYNERRYGTTTDCTYSFLD